MHSKTGLVLDPAAMTRLADLIEQAIREAGERGVIIEDRREARRRICKRVIAAMESGEDDPARLKQIAIASGFH
jgi:hypothetical protein